MKQSTQNKSLFLACSLGILALTAGATPPATKNPYLAEMAKIKSQLTQTNPNLRANGLERIGLMRSFEMIKPAIKALSDSDAAVRRDAAISLGLIGDKSVLKPLVKALNDSDWTVRQSAANALFNLTALDAPFDALAGESVRKKQAAAFNKIFSKNYSSRLLSKFKSTVAKIPTDRAINLAEGKRVEVSSHAYAKACAEYITDLSTGRPWKAHKNDKNPYVLLDLKNSYSIEQIIITTDKWVKMKDLNILASDDGKEFTEIAHYKKHGKKITCKKKITARYIKVTSGGSSSKKTPMGITELEVWNKTPERTTLDKYRKEFFAAEKYARALGFLGYKKAVPALTDAMKTYEMVALNYRYDHKLMYGPETNAVQNRSERLYAQALIRSLGLIGGPKAKTALENLFQRNNHWTYYAAQALGDCGNEQSALKMIREIPNYAIRLDRNGGRGGGSNDAVASMPIPDRAGLASFDRVPRTYFGILSSLCRMNNWSPKIKEALLEMSPYLITSIPNSWDGTLSYDKEPLQQMTGYIAEKADVRKHMVDGIFEALKIGDRKIDPKFPMRDQYLELIGYLTKGKNGKLPSKEPYAGPLLMSCAVESDIPDVIKLLNNDDGWFKINSARTLKFLNAKEALEPVITLLKEAKDDLDYGYDGDYTRLREVYTYFMEKSRGWRGAGYDEINDPSPRHKEAWLRLAGSLNDDKALPVLVKYLNNDRNAMEIQYAAALALVDLGTPGALKALAEAEQSHPVAVVKTAAREALWKHNVKQLPRVAEPKINPVKQLPIPKGKPKKLAFIKADMIPTNTEQFSQDLSAYSTTDGGPTYRLGRNIFSIDTDNPEGSLKQLTHYKSGWVSDMEVSYDGTKIMFSHREEAKKDPFWHIFEMNADGSDLKQLTKGPYSDVHANYMPDGRIVFTTTRTGIRDEYHGYPANGLAVMNADGTDIHVIGLNIGRDAEPVIGDDGKILFTRLELFYSRLKTEWSLLSAFPDGTKAQTLYGPERREFYRGIKGAKAISIPRHRLLRITQPQSWNGSEYLINSFNGPMITKGPNGEKVLYPKNDYAITTPFKIDDKTLLVGAGKRPPVNPKSKFKREHKKYDLWAPVDHGLHYLNLETGKLELIYNDPETAEFEARPIQPRKVPPVGLTSPLTRSDAFSGKIYCNSVFNTRQSYVKERGKYIRINEGIPTIARHSSHTRGVAWRNHGGAIGRIWGTVPLAADGSFALEMPADRLFHLQVLDANFQVVGNELIWQHTRPSEVKSCVGCHEEPGATPSSTKFPAAHKMPPITCFPQDDDVTYHAKMWIKGWAQDEREERMRVANAINLLGRE